MLIKTEYTVIFKFENVSTTFRQRLSQQCFSIYTYIYIYIYILYIQFTLFQIKSLQSPGTYISKLHV